jgi:hypothetical protein
MTMTEHEKQAARQAMARPGYDGPFHEHDGYAPHSHEVRADHEGIDRAVTWCDCGELPRHTTRVHPVSDEHLQVTHGPILTRGDLEAAEAEHRDRCT